MTIFHVKKILINLQKPIRIIDEFKKVTGYKINIKSIVFLCSSDELSGNRFKKTIEFTVMSKRINFGNTFNKM